MPKHTTVQITMTIKMRDFAAFEDLAAELGYPLNLVNLTPTNQPTKPASSRKHRVTEEDRRRIINYVKSFPTASAISIKEELHLPYAHSTINKIRRNPTEG